MDLFEDIRMQRVLRVRLHDDEVSIALKGHLLSEYLINQIIDAKISQSKKFLRYTYAKKLNVLENQALLTKKLISNLRWLNNIRNKMVHELDVSIKKSDMIFFKEKTEVINFKPKKGRYPIRQYLRLLSHGVLTQLINHMLTKLKVDPRWKHGFA